MLTKCSLMGFIPITDPERSRRFYVDVLKLRFEAEDEFAIVVSTDANTIRLAKVERLNPALYTILGWKVPDIAIAVSELSGAGITFLRYSFLSQDPLGIWTSPDGNRVAWFQDPDGNVLSISQH